jgi:hypothetical protein
MSLGNIFLPAETRLEVSLSYTLFYAHMGKQSWNISNWSDNDWDLVY